MSHETPPVFVKQHGAVRMVHALQTRSILPVQASRAVSHVVLRRRDPITRVCGATFKNHLLDGLDDADDTRVAFAGLSVSRFGKGLKKIHAGFGRGHNSAAYHPPCARSFSRRSWRETLCTRSPDEVPVGSSRGPHEGAQSVLVHQRFPPSLACTCGSSCGQEVALGTKDGSAVPDDFSSDDQLVARGGRRSIALRVRDRDQAARGGLVPT